MQISTVLENAEAGLADIGGDTLAGSGFENEQPDTDFAADVIAVAANPREN